MKEIPLTRGKVALVDDEDFESLSKHKWHASHQFGIWYARRSTSMSQGHRSISMQNEIMGGLGVDHINRNGLDNRRENLRFATKSQNCFNSKIFKNNKSGVRGVHFHKWFKTPTWRAEITVNGKRNHLGYFRSMDDAVAARQNAERKLV